MRLLTIFGLLLLLIATAAKITNGEEYEQLSTLEGHHFRIAIFPVYKKTMNYYSFQINFFKNMLSLMFAI
jgi:hypothetical protein